MKRPTKIVAAGHHTLQGIGTGTIKGTVTDEDGKQCRLKLSGTIVPGRGLHLFCVFAAVNMGAVGIFDSAEPRLEMRTGTVPLQQLVDNNQLYSFSLKLDDKGQGAEGGSLRSLTPSNGTHQGKEFRDPEQGGRQRLELLWRRLGVRRVYHRKSAQQAHPKSTMYNAMFPFRLVFTDLMSPSPLRHWAAATM